MNTSPSQADAGDNTNLVGEDPRVEPVSVKPGASAGSKQTARNLWLMKKTVLLIDVDSTSRDARSKVMRSMGVTVHCAATVVGARQKLESGSYNLVLVDLGSDVEGAKSLVDEIRSKNSRQLVAFLVGSPLFVATSLDGHPVTKAKARMPRVAPVLKSEPPAATVFDFGQKVRDAEAKEIA